MKRSEWIEIAARVTAWWPQAPWPEATMALYFDDLKDFPADMVLEATTSLYRTGRQWPPTGAEILAELADNDLSLPDFDHAWREINKAVQTIGGSTPGRARRTVDHLAALHPSIAELAIQVGVRDIAMSAPGDTTLRAQARRIYEAIGARSKRQLTHHDLETAKRRGQLDRPNIPKRLGESTEAAIQHMRELRAIERKDDAA